MGCNYHRSPAGRKWRRDWYAANRVRLLAVERARRRVRAWVNRMQAIELLGGRCSTCGYCASLDALEIDHIDPVRGAHRRFKLDGDSWARIEKALTDCQLLCANCHCVKTRQEARATGGWNA